VYTSFYFHWTLLLLLLASWASLTPLIHTNLASLPNDLTNFQSTTNLNNLLMFTCIYAYSNM
jgi:hypothetical protein